MRKVLARLRREPVAARGAIAAVLNVLVVGGVIDLDTSSAVLDVIQAVLLLAANVGLIAGARRRVTPER